MTAPVPAEPATPAALPILSDRTDAGPVEILPGRARSG